MPNRFKPVQDGTDQSQLLAIINRNFGELDNETFTRVYNDRNGVPSIVMGILPDGTTGLKVAKPGNNVLTTNNAGLVFNSAQNIFKIVTSGTSTQAVASLAQDATNTLTVAHNLGYIPSAIVYLNGTGSTYLAANRYYVPPVTIPIKIGSTYYPGIIYSYYVDATNIYFTVENRSALSPITDIGTANWKYYLLQETAN